MKKSSGRTPLALHIQIMLGLGLGVVLGLLLNWFWTPSLWAELGVDHPRAYFGGKARVVLPVLPDGVTSLGELDPRLESVAPYELTPAQLRQHDLRTVPAVPVLPQGVDELAQLDPALEGLQPFQLGVADVRRLGLEVQPANRDAGQLAGFAWFLARLNQFVGDLFIRLLRFIAVPIVLFSLIVGASSLNDLKKLSRIGGKTIITYICTTAVALTVGLLLVNLIRPGSARFVPADTRDRLAAAGAGEAAEKIQAAVAPDAWDTLLNIVPRNPFAALAETEMLQVVFFALAIGIALTLIQKDKAAPIIRACDAMTDVIVKLVHLVMKVAPYAVFALIVKVIAELGLEVIGALVAYALVVVTGLLLMMFVVYPTIMRIGTRGQMRYGRFFRGIVPVQLLAFSSSSSSATLPVTMECAEERLGIGEDVSSFVLPLGATINMDGTGLYQGVATVFIAQMFALPLGFTDQLMIVLTATLASIGAAGVPGVGLIMLIIVMQAVRMPPEVMTTGIAIILGVDRILDMCRTACNVTGDLMVATLVAGTEGDLLTEAQVEERARAAAQAGIDEHPKEPVPEQYDVPLGGPARPMGDGDAAR